MGIIPPFSSGSDRRYRFLRVFDQYDGARGGRIGLYVEGGVPPYTWVVTGDVFTLDDEETEVQYNFVTVAADADADVVETVTVTDDVGSEVTIGVCSCNITNCCEDGDYSFEWLYTPGSIIIEPGDQTQLFVLGGCPPYKWEVLSTEPEGREAYFRFDREYMNSPSNNVWCYSSCPDGTLVTIQVTDGCDEVITAELYVVATGLSQTCANIDYGTFTFQWDAQPAPNISSFEYPDDGDDFAIYHTGGISPFKWDVSHESVFFDDELTIQVRTAAGHTASAYIDEENCVSGNIIFSLVDACMNTPVWPDGSATLIVELICCCDQEDYEFTLDSESTPSEIDPNGDIDIYVQNGCPPFTWEVDGVGYSFDEAETTARVNTLRCGGGTCGADYAYGCEITVTDFCGTEVEHEVRNTAGGWNIYKTCNTNCGSGARCSCSDVPVAEGLYGYWWQGCSYQFGDNPCDGNFGEGVCPPWECSYGGYSHTVISLAADGGCPAPPDGCCSPPGACGDPAVSIALIRLYNWTC